MTKTEILKNQCRQLKLTAFSCELETILHSAEKNKISYLELIDKMGGIEIGHRQKMDLDIRTKHARLPLCYNLKLFDFSDENGLEKQQLN